jgi:hypothetical protein
MGYIFSCYACNRSCFSPIWPFSLGLIFSVFLVQIISAISGGITDLSFHAVGYAWQILNCFLTASYSVKYIA